MDAKQIRLEFEQFCGTERYNKFIAIYQLSPCHRLRFWQEQLWLAFSSQSRIATPSCDDSESLGKIFDVCHLHRNELQADTVDVVTGLIDFDSGYVHAKNTLFPLARHVVFRTCEELETRRTQVRYCSECRSAYKRWVEDNILPDVHINDVLCVKGKVLVLFSVPYPSAHKVIPGMKVFLYSPDGTGRPSSIQDLERTHGCFDNGSKANYIATLAGIDSDSQISIGTIISFVQTP